ncbi:roadblock/LC7 domain-containing protein [Actinocorallia sp. A-T 12471]|uniref:roadblock/LC7 domain-containing protein n=1 Tax=Actinocorallia sp. A-T 12471 TaxID=3089813 RepID=UPI0029D1C7F0|nr:roadblock/LC7 domain-containing protein [Actinocorallia sp. A-T 12471]MDX6739153.1 roadblock/LC7 domain-containing protein [Actinocorallia sp. A-T 12471]
MSDKTVTEPRPPRQVDKPAVLGELTALRADVPGVTETAVASVDGMLIVADTDEARPDVLAALAATTLGLGKSTGHEVGMGELREVVVRCATGHIVVYAVGRKALMVVLGDEGLDVARLHVGSRPTVQRLTELLEP